MKSTKNKLIRKIRKWKFISLCFLFAVLYSCSTPQKEKVDLIVHNAVVYTVDSTFSTAESFAVKDGKIIAVGKNDSILAKYQGEMLDAQGKAVFPGLIDAHCHFYGYGRGLNQVDLVDTKSFNEVIHRVVEFSKTKKGEWILGRGWDQNDWDVHPVGNSSNGVKEFPDRDRKSTRLNSSHIQKSRMPSSA